MRSINLSSKFRANKTHAQQWHTDQVPVPTNGGLDWQRTERVQFDGRCPQL